MAKYLDFSGLSTVMSNIFSVFQPTLQVSMSKLLALGDSTVTSGADVTDIIGYETAVSMAQGLIDHKNIVFTGGGSNGLIPVTVGWSLVNGSNYDFGIVCMAESNGTFMLIKLDIHVESSTHVVTLATKQIKVL